MKSDKSKVYFLAKIIILVAFVAVALLLLNRNDLKLTLYADGEKYKIISIQRGQKTGEPSAPEKEGYDFAGWYLDDELFDFNKKITKNMILEARYTKKVYTVTFKIINKNSIIEKVEYMDKVRKPENPTKEGYEFSGWYDGTKKFDFNTKITKNIVLEARWLKQTNASTQDKNESNSSSNSVKTSKLVNKRKNSSTSSNTTTGIYEIPKKEIEYRVEHYLMDVYGEYSIIPNAIITNTALEGTVITPEVRIYNGFSSPKEVTVSLNSENNVIKYYYERNKYNVTLEKTKGIKELIGTGSYYYQANIDIEATLDDYYEFAGWSNGESDASFTYEIPAKDSKFTANAKPIVYNIEYKLNGGTVEKENRSEYTVEDSFELTEPTKVGYTFDYWLINGKKSNSLIPLGTHDDLVIEAVYKPNTDTRYTVEHYLMDLDGIKYTLAGRDGLYGTTDATVTPNVRTYPGFTSPTKESLTIKPDGSAVLKYYYKRNKYNVTLEKGTGISKVTGSGNYYYGQTIKLGAEVEKGYTFANWIGNNTTYNVVDPEIKIPANNLSFKATATANKYTVTFDLNGGVGENIVKQISYKQTISAPENPFKEGYTFVGWYKNLNDSKAFDFSTPMPAENLTLYAKWEPIKYVVQFNANGGYFEIGNDKSEIFTLTNPQYNELLTEPTKPIRTGYTFLGWYKESSCTNKWDFKVDRMPSHGMVLYAKWQVNTYTIKFNPNGGEGVMSDQTFTYGVAQKLNANQFTRDGYDFVGWSDQANNVVKYQNQQEFSDLLTSGTKTLYAVWKVKSIQITYYSNTKENNSFSQTFTYTSNSLASNRFSKNYQITYNYDSKTEIQTVDSKFECWTDLFNGRCYTPEIIRQEMDTRNTQNINLYAKWQTPVVDLKTAPTKNGYKFLGWYNNTNKVSSPYTVYDNVTLTGRYVLVVNPNDYINSIIDSSNTTFDTNNKQLTVNINEPENTLTSMMASNNNLIANIGTVLNKDEVKHIIISYNNQEFMFNNSTTVTSDAMKLFTAITNASLTESLTKKQSILVGKTMTMKIVLDETKAITTDDKTTAEYKIEFVNPNVLTVDAYSKFETNILPLMNNHKATKYEIKVNRNNIDVLYANPEASLVSGLEGSGIKTAMQTFLASEYIDSIDIKLPYVNNPDRLYNIHVKADDVSNSNFINFGLGLLDDLERVTGVDDGWKLQNKDLNNFAIRIVINAKQGKYFQDGIINEYNLNFQAANIAPASIYYSFTLDQDNRYGI